MGFRLAFKGFKGHGKILSGQVFSGQGYDNLPSFKGIAKAEAPPKVCENLRHRLGEPDLPGSRLGQPIPFHCELRQCLPWWHQHVAPEVMHLITHGPLGR